MVTGPLTQFVLEYCYRAHSSVSAVVDQSSVRHVSKAVLQNDCVGAVVEPAHTLITSQEGVAGHICHFHPPARHCSPRVIIIRVERRIERQRIARKLRWKGVLTTSS